jgi:glutamate/tyrosine decarboxylase-like PLP-dependent enzyme
MPDPTSDLFARAAERAIRYREAIGARRVAPLPEVVERLSALGGPLPDTSQPPEAVFALLDEIGSPATVATAGGRYFGFVTGSSLPVTVAANWLATAWDQNAGLYVMSPVASELERIAHGWLLDILGLPAEAGVAFVTGATMANFTALAAARHAVLRRVGWDVEADGLFGAPPITVVVGAEAHTTLHKALSLLGLGRNRVVTVPVDVQGRMRSDALPVISGPAIVCLQAGNVNTGAFDPAGEILPWARRAGAWVHVDGAFGLWAAASPEHAPQVAEFAAADSWATDAHKWLNTTYDSGIALVRDGESLRAAVRAEASYLPPGDGRDPMSFTPQSSQRARGAEVWAVLAALGRDGVSRLVGGHVTLARRFASGLAAGGLDILNEVRLNQVVAARGDAETTDRMIAALQCEGTCWCGPTTWHGRRAMRASISNWSTTQSDVDRSIAAVLAAAR